VESEQHRFTTRLNYGLTGYSYSRRLAILGLESLELRRLHHEYTYKAIFGLIDIDCSNFFTVSPYSSTRGHDYKHCLFSTVVWMLVNIFVQQGTVWYNKV